MASLRNYKKHPGWQREYRHIQHFWNVIVLSSWVIFIGWLADKDEMLRYGLAFFWAGVGAWFLAASWTAWRWKNGVPKDVQKEFPTSSQIE